MFEEFVQHSRSARGEQRPPSMPPSNSYNGAWPGASPRAVSRAGGIEQGWPGSSGTAGGGGGYDGFEDDGCQRDSLGLDPITALETGFISSDLMGDLNASLPPIFQLGRVQYAFPAPLALLTVSANILTMCLYAYPDPGQQVHGPRAPPRLVRINLDDPERTEEAEVSLPPVPRANRNAPPPDPYQIGPYKMFADPSGRHLLLSMRNGDNYYWSSGWRKARALPRLKGIIVESVAWNRSGGPDTVISKRASSSHVSSTREILLGGRNGEIYECVLTAPLGGDGDEGDFFDKLARRTAGGGGGSGEIDRVLRRVFALPERQAITGICAEPFPSTRSAPKEERKAVVIATTSTRIYEFVGSLGKGRAGEDADGESLYEKLFEPYQGDAVPNLKSELPGDVPYSELHTWSSPADRHSPKALAWLTGPGVYHGLLAFSNQTVGDSVIDSANLLPYPAVALDAEIANRGNGDQHTVAEIPLSIGLTEFHFLLLYRDRVMGISSLDDRVVFEEVLPLKPHEHVISMTVDAARRTYWVYTDASIFELVVREEDRDVWRVYLDRNAHDSALRHAKTPAQRDLVLSSQGDRFYGDGRFIQAAQCYAQTFTRTFEEVVLRFIDADERDALRYYLVMRLERLRRSDVTQRVMLATWLVEIYLSKINQLEDIAAAEAASQDVENLRLEQEMLEDELRQFLFTYKENLDRKTVFGLIARHGRTDILLHYASVIGDYERIVRHWVQEEEWAKAIDVINRQSSPDIYYRFAPVLMRHAPSRTVDAWTRQPLLQPRRLIPALLQHRPKPGEPNQAVRYLQHVIDEQDNTDAAVHNFLLTLLATAAPHSAVELDAATEAPSSVSDDTNAALLAFIANSRSNPSTGMPYYDLDYALRTCSANGRKEACVRIYAKMGLFESAVDLALDSGDVDLACVCADMAENDELLRKKLWLKSAQFVVQTKKDIKTAMRFLDSTDLLSIEDILPFFPDFVVIDDFKEEICTALEGYASRIDTLKDEMDEATRSADAIKQDIGRLSKRFVTVEPTENCAACDYPLLARQFYVFPCQHAFHADCLIAETTQHLPRSTLRRILEVQEQLSKLTSGLVPALPPSYKSAVKEMRSGRGAEDGSIGRRQGAAIAGLGGVTTGLDRLRELIMPDAVVSAISTGVSVGVAGGKRVLAPLDPFSEPNSRAQAAVALEKVGPGRSSKSAEEEERVEQLRDELDGLVASACVLCEGVIGSIGRPFVSEREEEQDEWVL